MANFPALRLRSTSTSSQETAPPTSPPISICRSDVNKQSLSQAYKWTQKELAITKIYTWSLKNTDAAILWFRRSHQLRFLGYKKVQTKSTGFSVTCSYFYLQLLWLMCFRLRDFISFLTALFYNFLSDR